MGKTTLGSLKVRRAKRSTPRASIVRRKAFSVEDLLKHVDPGPREEAEELARIIYLQRHSERRYTFA